MPLRLLMFQQVKNAMARFLLAVNWMLKAFNAGLESSRTRNDYVEIAAPYRN